MNTVRQDHCAIIILAAGLSARLGTPKQTLVFEGKTLLRRSIEAAADTNFKPLVLVLGANRAIMEKELSGVTGIRIINNKGWKEGMASSIRCGVETAVQMDPGLDGLIIMVCDQPFVSTALLQTLIQTQQKTGMPVVASRYGDSPGVPALFHNSFFDKLLALKGDSGAKKLLKDQAGLVALIEFPEGETDIDTMNDFTELNEKRRAKE